MSIKETFLKLTSKTYPHGTESELYDILIDGLEFDEFGNRYIQVGESTCMFTSHLDTATSTRTDVNHVFEGNIIKTDGTSILGADDKAGVTIMFYMIKNKIPGLYYFFLGEEVGCVGSKKLSTKLNTTKEYPFDKINKVISFDRRGYDSVITYQASSRCCSDEFAQALADDLNKCGVAFSYKPDPTGIYTDSAQFTRIYPECTNISVGYKSEHTFSESQDIEHLEELAKACLKIEWEKLPVTRDPSKYEYRSYGYGRYGGGYDYWENEWDDYYDPASYGNRSTLISNAASIPVYQRDETIWFYDEEYQFVSSIKKNKLSDKLISVDFAPERLDDERTSILEILDSLEVDYESVTWDGFKLVVKHSEPAGHTTECFRSDLTDFLPDFNFWIKEIEDDYKGASIDKIL